MRYLYTTQPDEGCHEVEPGIYGRPVHTCDEPKLRKLGWSYSINSLRGTSDVRQKEEGRKEEGQVSGEPRIQTAEMAGLASAYEQKLGKKPHHKMKAETIRQKLEESDD